MKRLAVGSRLAALVALCSLPGFATAGGSSLQIALDPTQDVEVGWGEDRYSGDEVRFDDPEQATFVLTNRSAASRPPPELTISSSEPSPFRMVTLTAVSGRTTHMTSVMNPTGFDVLSFDPGWELRGGESVAVTVDAE